MDLQYLDNKLGMAISLQPLFKRTGEETCLGWEKEETETAETCWEDPSTERL